MCSALLYLHYSMRVRFVKEQSVPVFYHGFTGILPLKYLLPQSFVLGGGRPQDGGRSFPQKTEGRLWSSLREDGRIVPAVFRALRVRGSGAFNDCSRGTPAQIWRIAPTIE
jgi:hypothetical protein